ncbi:MAG: hypothetical protein ABIJ40_06635 [Bacteroidota bacterium]
MNANRIFVVQPKSKFMARLGTIRRAAYKSNDGKKVDYKPFDMVIGDYCLAIREQGHGDFLMFDGKNLKHFKIK